MNEPNSEIHVNPQKTERIEKPLTRRAVIKSYRRKLETTREEAEKDGLTGLPQRKAFDRRIREEASRLRRGGGKTTVIILDADKLKDINDSKGHAGGDRYLKSIADSLISGIRREVDFAARIGGDEFALILPYTDLVGAEKMWKTALNPAFVKNDIAISAGAAELDPNNPEESVKKADSGMYGAKRDKERQGENLLFSYVPIKQ